MKQNIDYWNSKESVESYVDPKPRLFDSEKLLLMEATERIEKKTSDIKILDLGCGGGRTTVVMHNMGYQIIGMDIAENLIQGLKKKHPKIHAETGDAVKLPFKSKNFDIVFFSHNSLDYLYPYTERRKGLQEINRVLVKNGYVIFSSHIFRFLPYNYGVFGNITKNHKRLISLRKKGYYLEKMSNGDVVETYSACVEEIQRELQRNGFKLIRSTTINEQEPSLSKTFLKAALNWERYYLAVKV